MNALASAPGWRDLAIWVMPSAVYALASDTLIGVIRAWAIARMQHTGQALADDEATPIALIGGLFLWLLRLALAPLSTIAGFRRWASRNAPSPPAAKPPRPSHAAPHAGHPADRGPGNTHRDPKPPGKQARMIALAAQRHDLTTLPLRQVSGIANTIGAEVDLSPGTARRVLLAHVRALQNGHPQQETHRHEAPMTSDPHPGRSSGRPADRGQVGVPGRSLPYRRLPRHRVRYLRLRLHLRLHPGAGHATVLELWLRWGRFAAFRRSRRARRSLTFWQRALGPASRVLDPDRPRALPAQAAPAG